MTEAIYLIFRDVIFPSYGVNAVIEEIKRIIAFVSEGKFKEESLENLFGNLVFMNVSY